MQSRPSGEKRGRPRRLLGQSRAKQNILFLLEEKIGRAQNEKSKENFSVVRRVVASGGGAERQNSAFGFSLKNVRISFSVRSQIVCCEFVASALRAANRVLRLQAICFEPKKSWKILADLPAEGRSPEAENSYHPIWLRG